MLFVLGVLAGGLGVWPSNHASVASKLTC